MSTRWQRQLLPSPRLGGVWAISASATAAVAGVVGLHALPAALPAPLRVPWPLLSLAWVLADLFPVRFPFRRQGVVVTFQEVPLLVGLVFCSPGQLLVGRLVAVGVVFALYKRQPIYKVAFNAAMQAVAVVGALAVYSAVAAGSSPLGHRGWLAAVAAAAVANGVSGCCVVAAVAVADRLPDRASLRGLLASSAAVALTNSCLGILSICVLWVDPAAALLLGAVTVVVALGYRAHQQLRLRHSVLERIHDFTQAVGGLTHGPAVVEATLTAVCQIMDADGAELLVRGTGGWVRHRKGPDGIEHRRVAAPAALEERVVRSKTPVRVARPASARDVRRFELDARQMRDVMCVPVSGPDLEATLTVHDRRNPWESFQAADVRALTSMAAHAAVSLASALLLDLLHREVEQKEYQALHDGLTGLPNRTLFAVKVDEALAAAGREGGSAAVMLLDLDSFKEVNDTLGHQVGDRVLKVTAARLQAEVGRLGTVARLGGDEFGVLLRCTDDASVEGAAAAVKRAVELPIEEDELLIEVRVSIGVTVGPTDGADAATLLRMADVAMYAAKEHRSGITRYETRHDHYSPRRLRLAGELRRAMADGVLTLAYQPQLDLQTSKVASVEALVRWCHPQHGIVPPDEFIPVAEQTGLIIPLTDYVLAAALDQQASWSRRGMDLVVAVNLSPRVVQDGNLAAMVATHLARAGVRPDRLTLELTETGLATDPERVASTLHQLAAMGVRTSIDDFGTGYSSLSRLSDLPVAEVKIDKSFVFAMAGGGGETLVRSIVDLGHNLKLRVVAEGVEDAVTLEHLSALRCHAAQGYYLSKPLAAGQLEAWLTERRLETERSAVIVPLRRRAAPAR